MDSKSDWTLIHARVHQTLRQRNLLPKQASILIAISGGQDSLCLGKLLLDLQSKWSWKIAIAHCDHRWSSDVGIAEHVQKIANNWQIPFYLKIANNLKETEAAARKWRYQALIAIAKEYQFDYVVTGHTKSDRAETFLYNLIRGAGIDGISSLTWQRALEAKIKLVRPLLNISRQETLAFCRQFQLPIWFDAVNHQPKYARNRIRQDLIPYLQTNFNPQVENSLAQTAELLRADVEYLENQAQVLLKEVVSQDKLKLNRILLRNNSLALQRRVIRQFLPNIINKSPNYDQIEAVVNLLSAPNKSRTSSLPGGAIAEVRGDWIVCSKKSLDLANNE
ncbi:MAG: tRNA lysidine(34) synthetase TilS [Xenococcaceae cyanobacterium]